MKPFTARRRFLGARRARGAALIEVLVSVLIFFFGVLGLLGFQVASMRNSGDAQLRSRAAMLANEYFNQVESHVTTTIRQSSSTDQMTQLGAAVDSVCSSWLANAVTAANVDRSLPNALANCALEIDPATGLAVVTVKMRWKQAGSSAQGSSLMFKKALI